MRIIAKYLFLLFFLPVYVSGQVYLSGMSSNPVIQEYLKNTEHQPVIKTSKTTIEPLKLPFYDDFSNDGPYPDPSRWLDNSVYINAHYPVFPVDYGVATFDVLNSEGKIYSQANIFPFVADQLTSYPLRLDSLFKSDPDTSWKITTADSLYLSFYFQPQGRGDAPLGYDSLALEFGVTDEVFSSISYKWLKIVDATHSSGNPFIETDTILPGDTVFYSGCDYHFYITQDTLYYPDSVNVACDSIYKPVTNWKTVWNTKGQALDTFLINNNIYFKMVMIPIIDEEWFRDNFQFRFYNYGSLSTINSWKGNTDHWHIDKVYLNTGRSMNDKFTHEIKFVEPAGSVIKNFSSMPAYHFNPDLIKESFEVYANNNDSILHNCSYTFTVQDELGNYLPGFTGGYSGPLNPYNSFSVISYKPFADVMIENGFDPQTSNQEVTFRVNHIIKDNENPLIGDTVYYYQVFKNYFAYDDGTAERSYGASADNTKIAVQFRSYEADTLRGVQIFFNQVQGNYNDRYFHIQIWNDNNGKPGSLIYEKRNVKPDMQNLDKFTTYVFQDEIIRLGIFNYYVGVTQTTFDNLNIGFDRNNNSKSRTFYNTSGTWVLSPFDGSLMIRPLFGKALTEPEPVTKSGPDALEIYPNPTRSASAIRFILPSWASSSDYYEYFTTRIYDLSGRLILSVPFEEQLNVWMIEPGFYIVDILDKAFTKHYSTKLLITK